MSITSKMNGTMGKLMSNIFAPIDGVVWDLMSNSTGIKREDGIYTLGKDGQVELNPFDAFSMELPAFSQLVPIDQVKSGDVLVSGGKATGWITDTRQVEPKEGDDKVPASVTALSIQGHQTRFRPKKVSMMGIENGITVVRSPFNFGGEGSKSGMGDLASMLPLLLLGDKAGGANGMDTKTLMLMSMMGGGGGMAGMNPMMLALLLGDDGGFPKR